MDNRKIYAYRKPGLFRSAGQAAVTTSAWMLISASLMAVMFAVVYRAIRSNTSTANIIFSAGLIGGALVFFRIARNEKSLTGRVAGRTIGVLLIAMAAVSLGVL